jgi:hypothetical protein
MKRLLVTESGGCCAVCGYDRSVVNLQFHHVHPAQKRFAMAMSTGKALATYREEAAKCVLVCANCRGEIEAGLIPSPPPQAKWGEEWTAVDPPPAAVADSADEGRSEGDQLTIELDLRPGRSSAGSHGSRAPSQAG